MAGGTITGSTGNQYIDSKIVWSATADNTTNKSTVTAALYYKRNNTGYTTYGEGTFTISIGGNKTSATKTLTITGDSWVKAVEATEIISHSTDGSKSITISATGSIPSTTLSSTSCSDTVDLDTIPRATTLDSLACATKYFTGKLTYKYTPQSSSYYNRCNISLNLDGTFIAVKSILLGKKTASQKTATVTLSADELAIIYNGLPKTDKGVLRFTFRTYSDSDYSKQVGDAKTKDITLYIPNNSTTKPTATMTLSVVNSLSSPFNTLYIKGRSKVDANFTNGKGKHGASIVSYKMNVGGKNYSSPYTSGYLTTTGNITVTGIITDSRGFSNEYEQTITVIPYSEPKILPASGEKNIICARCDSGGNLSESGTYLKIKAKRSYSKVVSGTQKNFCAIRYRYRDESTNTFSVWKDILKGSETDTDTIDATLPGVVSSTQTSYIVQVGVIDDMGEYDAVQFIIPTDFTTIDVPDEFKGRRVGLFRYVADTTEDGLYVGLPIFGGSIDSLKLGTRLTATESAPISLNDIKTPGCYYSPSAENSKYIADTPYTEGGFGLEVRELQSANFISQTMYFGRTRWTRHWNTTEWSDWLRFLMTTHEETTCADFVTEEGTKNGWTYKKWKSGNYQMFGVFAVKTTVAGVAMGNLYYSEQFALPSPFAVENACLSGSALSWFFPTSGGLASNDDPNNYIGFRLYRPTAFEAGLTISVRLNVTGILK